MTINQLEVAMLQGKQESEPVGDVGTLHPFTLHTVPESNDVLLVGGESRASAGIAGPFLSEA